MYIYRDCVHGSTFTKRFFCLKFSGNFPTVQSDMLSEGSCYARHTHHYKVKVSFNNKLQTV